MKEGQDFASLLPTLRSADAHHAPAPENSQAARPAHPQFNADNELVTVWPPPRPATSLASRPPSADGMVNGERLIRRLEALESALTDLPRQAKRLVRWRMRQEKSENPSFKTPLRPGRPPGHRTRAVHQVDELLSECHWLARYARVPDTS